MVLVRAYKKVEPETTKVPPIVPQASKPTQTLEVGSTYENPGTGAQFKITKVENGVPYGLKTKLGLVKTPNAAEVQLGFGVKWEKVEESKFKIGDTITNPATHSKYEIVGRSL